MNNRVDKGSRLCARHSRESLRKSHSCSIGLSSNSLDYDTHQLELIHFDSTSTPGNAVRPSDTLQSLSAAHFSSPSLPIRPLIDTSGRETEGTDLLSVGLSTTASQPQFAHVHHMTCTHCRQLPWPFTQNCLHGAFLFFFVVFLVVGVALTCLGFLDYNGTAASNSRAFRVLGIVALILCIGFLIAACGKRFSTPLAELLKSLSLKTAISGIIWLGNVICQSDCHRQANLKLKEPKMRATSFLAPESATTPLKRCDS